MRLSEIRNELLREHQEIRRLARETLEVVERGPLCEPEVRGALQERLPERETTLWNHNRHEEELLDDVLPTVDAWGPQRAQRMSAHHSVEYEEALEALAEARLESDPSRTGAILHDLLQHIAHE